MKKTIKFNTLGYLNGRDYDKGTYVQQAGLVMTLISAITAVVGTVLKCKSYKLYTSNTETTIDIDLDKK